jgi:FkbM family methyltransferase
LGPAAAHRRSLLVYAFEPNPVAACALGGRLANYVVLPFAVAETDGSATFHVNSFSASSSLLKLDPDGVSRWEGGELLREKGAITVPTVRLDTFMEAASIGRVDLLKVDAQGADLQVLRSAGSRIDDVQQIVVEAPTVDFDLYVGGARKEEIIAYLTDRGFRLVGVQSQSLGQEENLLFERDRSSTPGDHGRPLGEVPSAAAVPRSTAGRRS